MSDEYLIFPVKRGFEVHTEDDYKHLILGIGQQTLELIAEFPDKHIFVVYETEDEGTS